MKIPRTSKIKIHTECERRKKKPPFEGKKTIAQLLDTSLSLSNDCTRVQQIVVDHARLLCYCCSESFVKRGHHSCMEMWVINFPESRTHEHYQSLIAQICGENPPRLLISSICVQVGTLEMSPSPQVKS